MPPKKPTSSPSPLPLLPATLFLAGPLLWAGLETYAIQGYDGTHVYDFRVESISDLAVNYRQVHPLKHHPVTSYLAMYQNYNFWQAGALFFLGQMALLSISRRLASPQMGMLRTVRFLLAIFCAGGLILMGRISGGPRERHWEIIGWHWTGMGLAAAAGNVNALLAALGGGQMGSWDGKGWYRAVSAGLGLVGLYSYWRFQTLPEWDLDTHLGLWQRGTLYPILFWQVATAAAVIVARSEGTFFKAKTA